jgi:SAM-dependent methyltransferase
MSADRPSDPQAETTAAYEAYPAEFDERYTRYFAKFKDYRTQTFLDALNGKRVLDVGSGPGHYATHFRENGCDVCCLDISSAMVDLCRARGLEAVVADMVSMDLGENFDGIWANASLLHLQKADAPRAIERLIAHLKPGGLMFVSFKEGDGEGFETHPDFPGTRRWYARYRLDEAARLFPFPLLLLQAWTTYEGGANPFINLLLRSA